MHLLVGIDTEGDNQWDAAARANQTFENIYALPRLHALFARHGVRPTYVITHPVATDPRSAERAAQLVARRRLRDRRAPSCVGNAAVHPGRHPPASVRLDAAAAQFEEQLESLTAAIDAAVGTAAGVVSIGPIRLLRRSRLRARAAGYLVESSVAPLFYEAHKGGPEFVDAPLTPYFLAYDAPHGQASSNVLEVPVSRRAEPPASEAAAVRVRTRAAAVHDQARAARARLAADAVAAALLFLARGHDAPGAGSRHEPASRC